MGVCLSALLSCTLTRDELFRFPEFLSRFSGEFFWYESGPPESMTVENCENLIAECYLWIYGHGNIRVTPGLESIGICYGWSYSRFFTAEPDVYEFIEFCTGLAKRLGCVKIYFLPESICETLNYQQVGKLIATGELTRGNEYNRLSEYCDYDIYVKEISDSTQGRPID